jgi:predicted MFS family arabinose efflux permease
MAAPHRTTIALVAFLTVVDLFATQAILPELVLIYGVSAAAMGTAVNASTLGMVVACLAMAWRSAHVPRRAGVVASLALLAIPTALLASAPNLGTFAALRIAQGVLMATAFTLTLAYLAEETMGQATATAFAAYITGNVASNLFGRLIAAGIADHAGVASSFYAFAALNIAGAALASVALRRSATEMSPARTPAAAASALSGTLALPDVRACLAIGFCILFAFIGVFTYVNFVLVRPPIALGMMSVGLVYLVFLPSILSTPHAGRLAARCGAPRAVALSLLIAIGGLPLLLVPRLPVLLAGLVLVGIGTFLAQAIASGHVARAAVEDRGVASGLYLASYFTGGLVGSAVIGHVFVTLGWPAAVIGVGLALLVALVLARRLVPALPDQR